MADLRVGGPRPEAVHELVQAEPRAHADQGGGEKRGRSFFVCCVLLAKLVDLLCEILYIDIDG